MTIYKDIKDLCKLKKTKQLFVVQSFYQKKEIECFDQKETLDIQSFFINYNFTVITMIVMIITIIVKS